MDVTFPSSSVDVLLVFFLREVGCLGDLKSTAT